MISGPMPSPRMTVMIWVICLFVPNWMRGADGRRARGESARNYARRRGTDGSAAVAGIRVQQRFQLAGTMQCHQVVVAADMGLADEDLRHGDRKSTRLNSSH